MREYICTICGYVYKTDGDLPDDFTCPLCGAGKDAFVVNYSAMNDRVSCFSVRCLFLCAVTAG